MVTISTPRPMPETRRQKLSPAASLCVATMMFAAEYQRSDQVKIARRPNRSARKPHRSVPMKRPVNRAAMKLATPVVPKRPAVVAVSRPDLTRLGAT